jgi:hypothetical protein
LAIVAILSASESRTCPGIHFQLQRNFHDCDDRTLLKSRVISDFAAAEDKRRKKSDMTMKSLYTVVGRRGG